MKNWSGRKSLSLSCSWDVAEAVARAGADAGGCGRAGADAGAVATAGAGDRAKFVSCKGGAVSVGWSGEAG